MPHVIEKTAYKFDELSDRAKERARDWWRESRETDEFDFVLEDAATVAELLGITFAERAVKFMSGEVRYEPQIYFSVGGCQGDGASFYGSYKYRKGAVKAVKGHCSDNELIRIAQTLQDVQRRHFYRLQAHITGGHNSNFYSHSGTMSIDVTDREDQYRNLGEVEDEIQVLMRDFADWIYHQLLSEDDYLSSNEHTDEMIICNEYDFDENGRRI